jgi:hypothetical protein
MQTLQRDDLCLQCAVSLTRARLADASACAISAVRRAAEYHP